ncbi:MAG: S8 family serine peptidase [Lachnospiraceae bacterium]|nr:S8 family serine peptidase [Lachnospiraceae bacterium]
MKRKKILTSLLVAVTIMSQQTLGNSLTLNAAEKPQKAKNSVERRVPHEREFSKKEKKLVDKIKDTSMKEGKTAAEFLNEVDDEEVYEYALKNTLEELYTDDNNSELEEFIDTVESNPIAEEVIEDYQKAKEERENAENLTYDVNSIIIGYSPKTEEEYLDSVAEEQFGNVEQVAKTEENIDVSGLTQKKVEQIRNIDTEAKDVVAKVEISKGQTVEQAIEEYSQYANVEYVQPNYKIPVSSLTDDTYSEEQYYLDNINISDGWNAVEDFGFYQTFVAVIDTGAQMDHPDLKNVYIKKYCVDATQSGYPLLSSLSTQYTDFHGTAVAGIISAEANNRKGIAGVGTGVDNEMARIMAIKCSTKADYLDTNAIINGIYYAVDHGADVINISAGGYETTDAEQAAINYAYQNDVVVVAAAGNDNTSQPMYPASSEHVISVGATKSNNKKADFSNYGNYIDISAPGDFIYTCDVGSSYTWAIGTSFSAPIVSGTIAIMKAYGALSVDEIEKIIKNTATDIGTSNMGAGLINSGLAIQHTKYLSFKSEKEVINSIKSTSTKGGIKIGWRGNTSSEGFVIYRSTSKDGTYKRIKTITNNDTTSYTDTGLKSGKTYYYKVRGYMKYNDGKKYCQYSTVKSATAK